MVILRIWIRKEVVLNQWRQSTRWMGQNRRTDDDDNLVKADTQFSEPRVHCLEERSKKQRWWEIINTHLRLCGNDWNSFRTIISVFSSVFTEQSDFREEHKACHARTERLVILGQSDPLFVPTISSMKTSSPSTDDHAQEDLLRKYQERTERLSQQNRVISFVLMQDSWQRLTLGSTSWQKTLKNCHNLQTQWVVVRIFCQELKNHVTLKVRFEGIPKLVPS